jgi:hypothetical protein
MLTTWWRGLNPKERFEAMFCVVWAINLAATISTIPVLGGIAIGGVWGWIGGILVGLNMLGFIVAMILIEALTIIKQTVERL